MLQARQHLTSLQRTWYQANALGRLVMSGQCACENVRRHGTRAGQHQAQEATSSRVPSLKCIAGKRRHQELDQENTKDSFLTIYEIPRENA